MSVGTAFVAADAESESVPSGLSDLSKVQELGLSPSQISKVTELTGSFVGLGQPRRALPPGGWGNVAGYVVGVIGLLLAALMLVLYLTRPQ